MKDQKPPEPKFKGHFCPPEFERRYMAQYDLKDQLQMRRRTQSEVLRVKQSHGEPATESPLTGPSADWEATLEAVIARVTKYRETMRAIRPERNP